MTRRGLTLVGANAIPANTYQVFDSDDGFHLVQGDSVSVLEEGIVLFHFRGEVVHVFVKPISVTLADLTLEEREGDGV